VTPEQVAAQVRRELERADGARRLVAFDNVEDPAELVRSLPSAGSTQVVITTNRPMMATPGVARVEVGVFQPEQGRAFLAEATELPDGEDTHRLGEHLGWLPLGLAQAAAYIVADRLSYRQYLDLLSVVKLDEVLRQQAGAEHSEPARSSQGACSAGVESSLGGEGIGAFSGRRRKSARVQDARCAVGTSGMATWATRATAAVRLCTSSLAKMCSRCFRTVNCETDRWRAISLSLRPAATSRNTCHSRWVSIGVAAGLWMCVIVCLRSSGSLVYRLRCG